MDSIAIHNELSLLREDYESFIKAYSDETANTMGCPW